MSKSIIWMQGDSERHERSKCERFELFHLTGFRAQLLDKGTEKIQRKVRNFKTIKGAKIAANRWAKITRETLEL